MPYDFTYFIEMLELWGIADVLLPFLLIFTIVFAILQKSEILGQGKKNFNVIIALVIGLSVVIPHVLGTYPPGMDVVTIMNDVLPQVSLVAVAFLMAMLLAGLVLGETELSGWVKGLMVLIAMVAVIIIFTSSLGWWESGWLYDYFGEDTIALVVMILVFGLIIGYITKEGDGGGIDNTAQKGKAFLESLLGGGKS